MTSSFNSKPWVSLPTGNTSLIVQVAEWVAPQSLKLWNYDENCLLRSRRFVLLSENVWQKVRKTNPKQPRNQQNFNFDARGGFEQKNREKMKDRLRARGQ